MPKYPGLGLPLRYVLLPGDVLQPEHEESSGVEKTFSNAVSLPLAVRELAMMKELLPNGAKKLVKYRMSTFGIWQTHFPTPDNTPIRQKAQLGY
jgi:hypothetical protein